MGIYVCVCVHVYVWIYMLYFCVHRISLGINTEADSCICPWAGGWRTELGDGIL